MVEAWKGISEWIRAAVCFVLFWGLFFLAAFVVDATGIDLHGTDNSNRGKCPSGMHEHSYWDEVRRSYDCVDNH